MPTLDKFYVDTSKTPVLLESDFWPELTAFATYVDKDSHESEYHVGDHVLRLKGISGDFKVFWDRQLVGEVIMDATLNVDQEVYTDMMITLAENEVAI